MTIEEAIQQKKFSSPYQKAIINIIYTANWLNRKNNALLKPYDISIQQYNILRILRGQYPKTATIQILMNRMLDKTSNTSRLVEKLRLKSFVIREIDHSDRRSVKVQITPKGMDLLNTLDDKISAFENALKHIPEKDIQFLSEILDTIRTSENIK